MRFLMSVLAAYILGLSGAHAQSSAGNPFTMPFSPGSYPAYCSEVAKDYKNLPNVTPDASYVSPNEVIFNYSPHDVGDAESMADHASNALSSFGQMTSYAGALKTQFDKAAKAYWMSFDRTGAAPEDVTLEYGYWLKRREVFGQEVEFLNAPGQGAANFVGDTLTKIFSPPSRVNHDDPNYSYWQQSVAYDYYAYSNCTLKHASTVETAIEYELFLDAVPTRVGELPRILSDVNLSRFSADDKLILLNAMRLQRKQDTRKAQYAYSGVSSYSGALALLEKAKAGEAPGLTALLQYAKNEVITARSGRTSTGLGSPGSVNAESEYLRPRPEHYNRHAEESLFTWKVHPQKGWSAIKSQYFASGYTQAGECALDKVEDAVRYMYTRMPQTIENAAQNQVYPKQFCVNPRGGSLVVKGKPVTHHQRQVGYACMGHDAWRLAMFACASGQPVGQPSAIANEILAKYPGVN